MKKSAILIFVVIVLSGSWIAYRMYNKPHRDPSTEAAIQISSVELFQNFESDEAEANGRYLDKVLEVSGKVIEITTNQELIPIIVLETENPMFAVRCTMEDPNVKANKGEVVRIKGICTGYLSDVILVKGILVN